MQINQDTQPQSTTNPDKSQEQSNTNATNKTTPPTLLSYDQPSKLAPKYNDAGIYATRPNPSAQPKPPANPNKQPVSAAALSAVMATSTSSTDKMHSQPSSSRKVNDWNEDPTYRSRLASMVGSTRKWNYFGADIGGNPFGRGKK
jgi:hypothetical protein